MMVLDLILDVHFVTLLNIDLQLGTPVKIEDRSAILKCASTSLNSKVVSQHSSMLAPIAVDAVFRAIDPNTASTVDLNVSFCCANCSHSSFVIFV